MDKIDTIMKELQDMADFKDFGKMPKKSTKKSTKKRIINWLGIFIKHSIDHNKLDFSGLELTEKIKRTVKNPNIYPDTVLRYLREMREHGEVDYTCVNKKRSLYKIVAEL